MSISSAIWLTVLLANGIALAATFRRGLDRGMLWLRWYFAIGLLGNCFTHFSLLHFGYTSVQYKYAYFGTDLGIVVLGYFVLARLVELAFEKSSVKLPGLRSGAILLFTGLAAVSGLLVYLMRGSLTTTYFSFEMEQNFAFLGMILAIVLAVGMNVLQVPGLRFRRIVLSFSFLYSSGAVVYSLNAIIPGFHSVAYYAVPLTSLLGTGFIAYSLAVPEPEARFERAKARAAAMAAAQRLRQEGAW